MQVFWQYFFYVAVISDLYWQLRKLDTLIDMKNDKEVESLSK
jgi:hypothetical protein